MKVAVGARSGELSGSASPTLSLVHLCMRGRLAVPGSRRRWHGMPHSRMHCFARRHTAAPPPCTMAMYSSTQARAPGPAARQRLELKSTNWLAAKTARAPSRRLRGALLQLAHLGVLSTGSTASSLPGRCSSSICHLGGYHAPRPSVRPPCRALGCVLSGTGVALFPNLNTLLLAQISEPRRSCSQRPGLFPPAWRVGQVASVGRRVQHGQAAGSCACIIRSSVRFAPRSQLHNANYVLRISGVTSREAVPARGPAAAMHSAASARRATARRTGHVLHRGGGARRAAAGRGDAGEL
jgi:hypothetical protein